MDGPNPDLKELQPQKVFLASYNPNDQIKSDPQGEKGSYADPELYQISLERTRGLRKIQKTTGIPATVVGGLGLEWAIDNTPQEIGKRFQAHGIAKGDPIKLLDNILTKGIDPNKTLYSMPFNRANEALEAFGADHPKTEGGIIVISGPDQKLVGDGIRMVGLGEEYMGVVDLLQGKYPKVSFIPWHEIPETLSNLVGQKVPVSEADKHFSYPEKRLNGSSGPVPTPTPITKQSGDVW